jgi:hypothetical protein
MLNETDIPFHSVFESVQMTVWHRISVIYGFCCFHLWTFALGDSVFSCHFTFGCLFALHIQIITAVPHTFDTLFPFILIVSFLTLSTIFMVRWSCFSTESCDFFKSLTYVIYFMTLMALSATWSYLVTSDLRTYFCFSCFLACYSLSTLV